MEEKHRFGKIDKETFDALLEQYPNTITDPKLRALDEQRLKTIPVAVHARKDAHLTRSELIVLMDWKLSHGKFRPSLQKLVQENIESAVLTITGSGFKLAGVEPRVQSPAAAIKKLCDLRGVGPATASLLLAVYMPDRFPFFSDELYRWIFWIEGSGNGWDRRIQYTEKEYVALYSKVQELRDRLGPSSLEAEKVAYVLCKATHGAGSTSSKPAAPPKKRKAVAETSEANLAPGAKKQAKTTKAPANEAELSPPEDSRLADIPERKSATAPKERTKVANTPAQEVRRSTRNKAG